MKKHKDYLELTLLQFIGLIAGTLGGAVFIALWLNGELYQYGI